jgi:hypothetical protein
MKRRMQKKLALTRESLRQLDGALARVAGGRTLVQTECECTARLTSCLECFQNPPHESFPCGETDHCVTF